MDGRLILQDTARVTTVEDNALRTIGIGSNGLIQIDMGFSSTSDIFLRILNGSAVAISPAVNQQVLTGAGMSAVSINFQFYGYSSYSVNSAGKVQ